MSHAPPPSTVEDFNFQWRHWLQDLFNIINTGGLSQFEALILQNSWVDFGGADAAAAFVTHPGGLVEVKGNIKDGTATAGTVLATLPVGFRPLETRTFPTISNNLIGRVDVKNNGDITIEVGTNTSFSLDSIIFWAEQ